MGAPQSRELAEWLVETSPIAAEVIVPWIHGLVRPETVVDVGCGVGSWLARFEALGATIRGFDGYDPGADLEIPRSSFEVVDLAQPPVLPVADLAVCLEVGEHLPPASAPRLIAALTEAAPVVMFSAAVPGQRGIGHINEQWPSFWRALFEACGYVQVDAVRRTFWSDDRIPFWYRQNMFVYVRSAKHAEPFVEALALPAPEDVVHPALLERAVHLSDPRNHGLRAVTAALPVVIKRFVGDQRRRR